GCEWRPPVGGLSDGRFGFPHFGFFPPRCAIVGTSPLGLGWHDACNAMTAGNFTSQSDTGAAGTAHFEPGGVAFWHDRNCQSFGWYRSPRSILSHTAMVMDRERHRHSSLLQVSSFQRSEPDARLSHS